MPARVERPTDALSRLAAFFDEELDGVAFPGVDRPALDEAMREHAEIAAEVAAAEVVVERAREALQAQEASMASLMDRALAYLRVYAADDAELLARLDEVAPRRRATKKGRRRKAPTAEKANDVAVPDAPEGDAKVARAG